MFNLNHPISIMRSFNNSLKTTDKNTNVNKNFDEELAKNIEQPQRSRQSNTSQSKISFESDSEQSRQSKSKRQDEAGSVKANKSISMGEGQDRLQILEQYSKVMREIQLLDYHKTELFVLEKQFNRIIEQHVQFQFYFPTSKTKTGQKMLEDGLFYEMWGKILIKKNMTNCFPMYYSRYSNKITTNYSNFQSIFNTIDSSHEKSSKEYSIQNTQTRLPQQKQKVQLDSSIEAEQSNDQQLVLNMSSKQNLQLDLSINKNAACLYNFSKKTKRLVLTKQLQTNDRRNVAQLTCQFFNITRFYKINTIELLRIFQCYRNPKMELMVVEAQVSDYQQSVGKVVTSYRPKVLISAYKILGLTQLLRLKKCYGQFQGFIVYDDLIDVDRYLKHLDFYNDPQSDV